MSALHQKTTQKAFNMMSQIYQVERIEPDWPDFMKQLGPCRVVAVVVHESESPEVGLQPIGSEDFDYYPFDGLRFESVQGMANAG